MERARPAVAGDLPRLAELAAQARSELVAERGGPLWALREWHADPAAAFGAALHAADRLLLAGCLDDVVVGYGLVHREPLRDGTALAVVTDLYVEPEARGVGVGEALMDEVMAWARAQGCRGVDALALPGMRETKNFFERFGLVARAIVVHRPFTEERP